MSVKPGLPRFVDATVAALALAVCFPLILVAALMVLLSSGFPVIFRQQRVGRFGRPFTLYKFRTMRKGPIGVLVTARNDVRITWAGRILRKSKLDELPGLVNVLTGEMSLVGPRPEVLRYVDRTDARWREVLHARPGLTDPVTLRLRNEEELMAAAEGDPERFYLRELQPFKLAGYAEYLRSRTAGRDIKILTSTFVAILLPSRAPAPTVEEIRSIARSGHN